MAQVTLGGNADAVEFCPNKPYLHILAAASYTLQEGGHEEGGPIRLGGLYLFSAEQRLVHSCSSPGLAQLHHHETPGVFDIKWRPFDDSHPCLAEASADGSVRLHSLVEGPETLELEENATADVSSSMCLYVDWSPQDSNPQVAVSLSDGSISVVDLGQSEPEVSASWQAHGYEAWVVTYDAWKPQVVYSGGDDSQFCSWDLRDYLHSPVFRDRKTHQMGVCSIQSNPLWENVIITGSYDENVRLWDLRMMQNPIMKAELGLGGGVWRLKWHYSDKHLILAACMHNGATVAHVGGEEIEVLEQYKEHTSLTYGASWFRGDWVYALDSREVVPKVNNMELEGACEGLSVPDGSTGLEESEPLAQNDGDSCSSELEGVGIMGKAKDTENDNEERLAGKLRKLDIKSPLSTQSTKTGTEHLKETRSLVATCSFYDKGLHLWLTKT